MKQPFYCVSHGISVQGTQHLINSVNNKLSLEYHTSNNIQEVDKSNADFLIDDFRKNDDKYKLWYGGPFFTSFLSFKEFVDDIINIVFLGIIKATQNLINLWIKDKENSSI